MKTARKGALLAFKRALVRPQKGIYCKPIRRLFKAKRAYTSYKQRENSLHIV